MSVCFDYNNIITAGHLKLSIREDTGALVVTGKGLSNAELCNLYALYYYMTCKKLCYIYILAVHANDCAFVLIALTDPHIMN